MLPLLGSPKTLCDGVTRRDFLHVGSLSLFGLSLADELRQRSVASESVWAATFGKAKACILIFPYGSPSSHETFDPKPEAPAEIRGEMNPISTSVPGLHICEGLPRLARVMDRLTVIRSMTHPYPVHGAAYAMTGMPTYSPALEDKPRDAQHWPFIGSVVDYLEEKRAPRRTFQEPRNVALPWMLNSKTDLLVNAGPFAAFLGQGFDPVWTDFDGKGTAPGPINTSGQAVRPLDPYAGTTSEGRFSFTAGSPPGSEVPLERIDRRRSLLAQFDEARRELDWRLVRDSHDRYRAMAYSLLTSGKMRDALDVAREPAPLRERYGMTLFGQGCLTARRLVEAGCKFVTVFWDGYGKFANCGWDTHYNHFPRLKDYLLPGFDPAFSSLILDLETRGLLDSTLVVCMSEHGRTPRIDTKAHGGGRHHWSRAYCAVMAGAGVPRGKVVGATEATGGDVRDTPVSPKDILATTYHLLGFDPESTTVPDFQGRPHPIAGAGRLRGELLD